MTAAAGTGTSHPDRKRVGFIGLGHMGSAIARSLLEAGYEVTVWSRSPGHVDELVADGAVRADTPAEAIATGHLFSMLANESVVREVLPPALLRRAPSGFVHVNHATISAAAADEFAAEAVVDGYGYVAAPGIGRPDAAAAGALTILAAGPADAVAASLPMLEVMGRRVWPCGSVASAANLTKISVNYLIVHALQALAESITLLERNGLDPAVHPDHQRQHLSGAGLQRLRERHRLRQLQPARVHDGPRTQGSHARHRGRRGRERPPAQRPRSTGNLRNHRGRGR